MKKWFFFAFLFALTVVPSDLCAQTLTEKWNEYHKRTEFFDAKGKLTGWSKFND